METASQHDMELREAAIIRLTTGGFYLSGRVYNHRTELIEDGRRIFTRKIINHNGDLYMTQKFVYKVEFKTALSIPKGE